MMQTFARLTNENSWQFPHSEQRMLHPRCRILEQIRFARKRLRRHRAPAIQTGRFRRFCFEPSGTPAEAVGRVLPCATGQDAK